MYAVLKWHVFKFEFRDKGSNGLDNRGYYWQLLYILQIYVISVFLRWPRMSPVDTPVTVDLSHLWGCFFWFCVLLFLQRVQGHSTHSTGDKQEQETVDHHLTSWTVDHMSDRGENRVFQSRLLLLRRLRSFRDTGKEGPVSWTEVMGHRRMWAGLSSMV